MYVSRAAGMAALAAVVVCTLVVVAYAVYKNSSGPASGGGAPAPWAAVRAAWPSQRGAVINAVIGADAGPGSAEWINLNAPHGRAGAMAQADADVVCGKALDGWGGTTQVVRYCDPRARAAVGFGP